MTDTTPAWPYDADQDDPLTALRIPVVRTPYPQGMYEVCVMISDPADTDPLWPSLRPDETEVKQILAFLDYRMDWYNPGWQAQMRRRPLDTDSGTNTVILRKLPHGGWCHRRATWTHGPVMVPPPSGDRLTLEQVLDKIGDASPGQWAEWKARYPDAFPQDHRRGTVPPGERKEHPDE